jgi:ribosomal protein S18 acetylase RimI-like enzyme
MLMGDGQAPYGMVRLWVISGWYGADASAIERAPPAYTRPMSDIVIAEEPADSADVRWCFEQYYAEVGERFGFILDQALPLGLDELVRPRGLVLIARRDGDAVGCGALKLHQPRIGEIKRMWVANRVRGRGLGGRLLEALEGAARIDGKSVARLETNRTLTEAVAMYRRHGYREVPAFNEEAFGDHWFEKDLCAP